MEFRKTLEGEEEAVPVVLPARSLLVMTGEARYLWTHGIAAKHFDYVSCEGEASSTETAPATMMTTVPRGIRVSLTFRTVCKPPCICNCGQYYNIQQPIDWNVFVFADFPLHCDSKKS